MLPRCIHRLAVRAQWRLVDALALQSTIVQFPSTYKLGVGFPLDPLVGSSPRAMVMDDARFDNAIQADI